MSCVQVHRARGSYTVHSGPHSTCWAYCWQRSETALAIAEVVEDHKHSRVAQLSLGAHEARFKRNRALPIGLPGAATGRGSGGVCMRGAGLGQLENGLGKSGAEGEGARREGGFGLVSVRAIQW